jgi:formyl-CoA transferase
MGKPELADDPRFNTREARRENQAELTEIIGAWTATNAKEEIYHTLQGLRTVAGYVATVEDLRASEQLRARDFFHMIDHPSTGEGVYPGALFSLQDTSWQHGRAPLLGEHNSEIYGERLGYSLDALAQLHSSGII